MRGGRIIVTMLTVFAAFSAHGVEMDGDVSTSSLKVKSPYDLLTFKREPEAGDDPETTPQAPPLDIDDPSTPGCNTWEINIVASGDLVHSQNSWELPHFDFNYGVGDNLQLKYEVPYVIDQSGGSNVAAMG